MGFLATAVLPPGAYLIRYLQRYFFMTFLNLSAHTYVRYHRYGCLIATRGTFACIPPLLGWLLSNLCSTAGTGLAIALNVLIGAPGHFVGVWIYKVKGLSDRELDQRGVSSTCLCGVSPVAGVLWMEEEEDGNRRPICVLGEILPSFVIFVVVVSFGRVLGGKVPSLSLVGNVKHCDRHYITDEGN